MNSKWNPFSKELLISIFAIGLGLEILVGLDIISSQLLPPPMLIIKTFLQDPRLFISAFTSTLTNSLLGFVLSVSIGLFLSFIFSLSGFLRRAVLPLAIFFQTVPIIALAPLLVIYFGFGTPTVIASSLIVSIFPVIANTLSGLDQIRTEQLELFQIYKASPLQILFKLRIPSAYSTIIAGFKISSGLAIIGTIAGEFVAGGGLGALIDSARTQQRVDSVFVCLFLLAIQGLIMLGLIQALHFCIQKIRPYGLST